MSVMSLSGVHRYRFPQQEEEHHWKCTMYLANFCV